MIGDFYNQKWNLPGVGQPYLSPPVNRYEFEQLRKEVQDMRELLKRAKKYDEETNQKRLRSRI
jgi:hypothetical protein